ncbi:PREDICTED: E3 ubiquitin-protein ligase At3g02290-like isoform X2 [Tarenaya hassleriana]|uniref:E3 ubiquitin-protein ligase At3g02290-like isoform X2 n=1 Tax=Tarenaya hassleriana TaxID=28532 RepID=UPI00053C5CD0|nr:PREDICTED: E3 ubiquitin-protein ligase At3g02290-like isoform X2 [Tarenaya hassleriana]
MGGVCSCFRVEDFEEYINPSSSVYRNCPCLRCLAHNFLNVYISLFRRGETRSLPSSLQSPASITSSASHDNFLSDAFRSTPRPLPYDADPSVDSESFGGGGGKRASQSVLEDGSKEEYSKSTLRILQSKTKAGTESMYILSEDEDVCPTCLEEYTLENPKIVTKCSHHFHLGCIYEWMERSENCPVCGKVMEFNETP